MNPEPELPVLQALILADHVYTDTNTGKRVIAGTFSRLFAREFHPKMHFSRTTWAYVSLTNMSGKYALQLQYVDLENKEKQLMKSTELQVDAKDPLGTLDFAMEVPPFPMPHPGKFAFELLANGAIAGSLRLSVEKVEDK